VLVHDAARPFVSRETVDAVLAVAESGSGAVPGLPVADTLKRVQADRTVSGTLARENLWRASTPQGFPRAVLERAFAAAGEEIAHYTDEAALVEALGQTVTMVPDTATNLKITTPEDFELAEALARL
jgi:2-C-methyl-D-erythritol 4-phosphate cytidylyltransferase